VTVDFIDNTIKWFKNTLIMKNVHAHEYLMGTFVMFWIFFFKSCK
jgi:hypothetical protein